MNIVSPAFQNGGTIPAQYTCNGQGSNPPLAFVDVPKNAKTLVLIVEDIDVPRQFVADGIFDHWILFNIPSDTMQVAASSTAGIEGKNSAGTLGYVPPCPPPNYEPPRHRYAFNLYALNTALPLSAGASKKEVRDAIEGHILATAELVGLYEQEH